MDKKITNIISEQIVDSRNNPTLKVTVFAGKFFDSFQVPSGASTGLYEAFELRDDGTGDMSKAILNIEKILKPKLLGIDVDDQASIDQIMIEADDTLNKSYLGGNSMIGVSIACAKTASKVRGVEVYEYLKTLADIKPSSSKPWLYFNLINGGKHAKSHLAFQEYHIVPQADSIKENISICKDVQKKLDEIILSEVGSLPAKGDEGGIALSVESVIEPLNFLKRAVVELGYEVKVRYALDVAASSFYDEEKKKYIFMEREWNTSEMMQLYKNIIENFPMVSIEDPFNEEDYQSFADLQKMFPSVKIVGDDLTVTNIDRLNKAILNKSICGIIIKPNQIGTLSETLATMKLARENNIDCIVSHRSGETMDDFIADLAYAFGCFGIKSGALGPKERNVKYDRLVKISN